MEPVCPSPPSVQLSPCQEPRLSLGLHPRGSPVCDCLLAFHRPRQGGSGHTLARMGPHLRAVLTAQERRAPVGSSGAKEPTRPDCGASLLGAHLSPGSTGGGDLFSPNDALKKVTGGSGGDQATSSSNVPSLSPSHVFTCSGLGPRGSRSAGTLPWGVLGPVSYVLSPHHGDEDPGDEDPGERGCPGPGLSPMESRACPVRARIPASPGGSFAHLEAFRSATCAFWQCGVWGAAHRVPLTRATSTRAHRGALRLPGKKQMTRFHQQA